MLIVEIIPKESSSANQDQLTKACQDFLKSNDISSGSVITDFINCEFLKENAVAIIIGDLSERKDDSSDNGFQPYRWLIYRLDKSGPQEDITQNDDELLSLSTNWVLPSENLHGMWENLIYEKGIKQNLLKFVETALLFSSKKIDTNVISSNRVVLLHGPPGTGKTSLCRALAHKVAARLYNNYSNMQLIQINSHSLFSKWFSESGKLVTKMFSHIREICEDSNSLLFVLIDEIESLAHARNQFMSGTEPSDAIRVVNALLTQIDQMSRYPNVLILTTSNMTGAIDIAFVDRADIKQYIGLPSVPAIYQIYYTCLRELKRIGIIHHNDIILPVNAVKTSDVNYLAECSQLLKICHLSVGLSGRTLRKIPFLAHALFIQKDKVTLCEYLDAMKLAVEKHKEDLQQISA